MYGYVICEYEKVKEQFPDFKAVMDTLHANLIAKATKDWSMPYGGMAPMAGQFGETTVMPELFLNAAGANLVSWDQVFTAAMVGTLTNQAIIWGSGTGGTLPEDYKVGLAGLVFLDKAIRISEIKMQISDKKIPRINLEEALAYNKPAVVLEEGFILDEETGFELYAYVHTPGPQAIKLLGFQLYRVPNKLQVTNTGATPLT